MALLSTVPSMMAVSADDVPWTYDTSRRIEPMPDVSVSSASVLCAKAQNNVDSGALGYLSSFFRSRGSSPGCDLKTLPMGLYFIFR